MTLIPRHARRSLVWVGCALALMVGGCAGDPGTAAGGGRPVAPAADGSPSPLPVSPPPVSVPTPTPDAAGDAPSGSAAPADCLVGRWLADNEFFLNQMRQFGDVIKSVTGEVHVTFAAQGSVEVEYRQWLITGSMEGRTVTITRDGTDSGTFSATDSTIDIAETTVGSTLTVDAAGMRMPIEPQPANYRAAAYTCDATRAVITTTDGELRLTRP